MVDVLFDVVFGETYHIAVDGADGTTATFDISLTDETIVDIPLPSGALGMLDFKEGSYKWGVDAFALSDILTHPEYRVDGFGLYSPDSGDPAAFLSGTDFWDFIVAGDYVMVFEFWCAGYFAFHVEGPGSFNFNMFKHQFDSGIRFLNANGFFGQDIDLNETGDLGVPPYNVVAIERNSAVGLGMYVEDGEFAGLHTAPVPPSSDTPTGIFIGGDDGGVIFNNSLVSRILFYPVGTTLSGTIHPIMDEPENDDFADATTLTVDGAPITSHNFRATVESGEPAHTGSDASNSVWFKFTAAASVNHTITLASNMFFDGWGAALAVYTGSPVGSLSLVDSDSGYPVPGPLTFMASIGETYHIAVDSASGSGLYLPGAAAFTIVVET